MHRLKIKDIPELFHEVIKKQGINIQLICPISITASTNILQKLPSIQFHLEDLHYGTIFVCFIYACKTGPFLERYI